MDRVVESGWGDVEAEITAYKDSPYILKMLQGSLRSVADIFSGGITGEAVDLGCGDGRAIEIFCNDYPELNWTGLDSSSHAISAANTRKLASSFSSQMSFVETDFTTNTTQYDFCLSSNALHHISTGADFWDAVKDSTKSGGKIYVTDFIDQIIKAILMGLSQVLKRKMCTQTHSFGQMPKHLLNRALRYQKLMQTCPPQD